MKSCTQDLQKGGDAFDVGFCDGWVEGWINEFHKDGFYCDNDKKELWALD
jgi:hypothetical protein